MKYTFSVHGVPEGSQAWGDISDRDYIKSFYNSVSADYVPTQMIVDIRYSGNNICTYYHYLILSNVDSHSSRPGSYFGMSICFENAYCSDFLTLYRLFNECFNQVVLNSLLVQSENRFKFAFNDFDSPECTSKLTRINDAIRNNIGIFERHLAAFHDNYTPKHRADGGAEKWALDDVGNNTFVNVLLRDAIVSISPDYPITYKKVEILQSDNRSKDNRIKALESNNDDLQSQNKGLLSEISDKEKEIGTKDQTIQNQNSIINQQKRNISSLKTKNTELENLLKENNREINTIKEELRLAQNNRDDETLQKCFKTLKEIAQKRAQTDQLIDAINPRLKRAEEKIKYIDNQLNKNKPFRLKSSHVQIGGLIIVAIIAIIGIFLPEESITSPQPNPSTPTIDKKAVRTIVKDEIQPILTRLGKIEQRPTYYDTFKTQTATTLGLDGNQTSYIAIMHTDQCFKGKSYTVKARKGTPGKRYDVATGGGNFYLILGENVVPLFSSDNGKTAEMFIPDNSPDSITIQYRFNDTVIKERKINVYAQ